MDSTAEIEPEIGFELCANLFLKDLLDERPPLLIETITILAAGHEQLVVPAATTSRELGRPITERDIEAGRAGPGRTGRRPLPPDAGRGKKAATAIKRGEKLARVQLQLGACDFTEASKAKEGQ